MEANGNSCSKTAKFHPFFQEFLRKGCQLWTQISQLLIGQIEKFWCLSDREFPEFFKTHPTFVPSPFQSGVISKMPRTCGFFWDTMYITFVYHSACVFETLGRWGLFNIDWLSFNTWLLKLLTDIDDRPEPIWNWPMRVFERSYSAIKHGYL